MELTERMTPWQRDDTLAMARAVLTGEAITEEQLVHRLRANLRMIGGGNRSTSPYGFARKTLFRKPFGCDDPYCEDGKVFTADPAQPPRTARAAPSGAWTGPPNAARTRPSRPSPHLAGTRPRGRRAARGPRHPSDREQPWCGACDQRTRLIEIGFWDREPAPCPDCAPIPAWMVPSQKTGPGNLTDPLGT
ncbi:hypothetical protein ACFQ9X_56980 [Catenulispora yoronensis]